MAEATTSYGQDLPDQFSVITESVSSHIALTHDVSAFITERAALEREYSKKLQALTDKVRERRDKRLKDCTVGSDPAKMWSAEVANRSSLQRYLSAMISTSDSVVNDHNSLADSLDKVATDVVTVGRRGEEMRKKVNVFYDRIVADREKVYSDRVKAKSKYDEHCHDTDSHRQKKEKAETEERHIDRARKSHGEAQAEMWNAKNIYLIAMAASNKAKQRFFREDLPRIEDDLQSLWELVDSRLVTHIQTAAMRSASTAESIASKHRKIESEADQVVIGQDQAVFTEFNKRRYDEPADLTFEPCVGFFDTPEMVTEDSASVFLQNLLLRKRTKMAESIPLANAKTKEVQGLERLRDAYMKQQGLGDPEEVTDNLFESIRNAIVIECQLSLLEAEVDTISEAIGADVSAARPHRFKATKFALPTTCQFCQGKVFGLGGLVCQPCGFICHAKCEPKVPATCRAAPAQKQDLPDMEKRSSLVRSSTTRSPSSSTAAAGEVRGTGASAPSAAPVRRSLPPAASATTSSRAGGRTSSTSSSSGMTASQRRVLEAAGMAPPEADDGQNGGGRVTAMFSYEATSSDELAMQEGEKLTVVEGDDDDSGWMKVQNARGQTGLVPSNYVQPDDGAEQAVEDDSDEDQAGAGEQVRAIYDYDAAEANELTLREGDVLSLTAVGFDYGSGWCEGVKGGKTGVFPANYVEAV